VETFFFSFLRLLVFTYTKYKYLKIILFIENHFSSILQKYRFMTGGSRSRFLILFALKQLKAFGKSGFHNKLPTGSRWSITANGQNTDSQPENDVKESVVSEQESESKGKVEEVEDKLVDERYRLLLSLHKCIYDPLIRHYLSTVEQQLLHQHYVPWRPGRSTFNRCVVLQDCAVF